MIEKLELNKGVNGFKYIVQWDEFGDKIFSRFSLGE